MNVYQAEIADIFIIEPKKFEDKRGYFFESFKQNDFNSKISSIHFVQENQSLSKKGTFRGLHYQLKNPQGKLVSVVKGKVLDIAVDV